MRKICKAQEKMRTGSSILSQSQKKVVWARYLERFFRCDFIQMGYFIHVVARTPSVLDDIVVKLPIMINPKVRLKTLLILWIKYLIN